MNAASLCVRQDSDGLNVPGTIRGGVVFRRRIPVPARVAVVDLLRVLFLARRTILHGLKLLDCHSDGSFTIINKEFIEGLY